MTAPDAKTVAQQLGNIELPSDKLQAEIKRLKSISHYLGRFRRANELSLTQLGKISGLGAVIGRWEKFI